MDISKILDYQKLDTELFKLEKRLRDNPNKKTANEMSTNAKNAQQRSFQLEEKAGSLIKEIDTIKKQFEVQTEKMQQIMAKDLEKLSKEEVDSLLSVKDKLAQNLTILDKNLTKLAESVNAVLADFNKTLKVYNAARDKFAESKAEYDKEVKELEPTKQKLEKELASLEKGIEAKLMTKYKEKRSDNIFPVLVPLKENSCGGCHMELPAAQISKLQNDGIYSCEHCHRIIYFK